jgi:hypothetical protein
MKTSSLLLALLATSALVSATHAAPPAQLSSSAAINYHWVGPDGLVIGPKANPGVLHKAPQKVVVGQAGVGRSNAAAFDEYCGNGKKPIPVGPGPQLNGAQQTRLLATDIEPCGTRVPGRIPGGIGPGPR